MAGAAQVKEAAERLHQEGDMFSPLHELLSTRARFREFWFSQFFREALNLFVIPGKECGITVHDDFHVTLFHRNPNERKCSTESNSKDKKI
jgi:hypothetical protein